MVNGGQTPVSIIPAGESPDMTLRNCPICDTQDATPVTEYSRDAWDISACDSCGHVYLRNPPGYGALVEDFAWEKTYVDEHARRLEARPLTYRLDLATRARHSWFRKPLHVRQAAWFKTGNLLNVGCGDTTDWFQGFTPFGIEISKALAEVSDANMRALGGFCVHGPGATAIGEFDENFFDGIIMRSYLEHEEEPLKVLKGAARALKPEGAIYVRVPNYNALNRRISGPKWCGFRYPDHVNYFTVPDLKKIAAQAGLEVSLLNPIRLPFDDNINALLRRAA